MITTSVEQENDDFYEEKYPNQIKATPYDWPHDASLNPKTTALIVIDMQRDFCEEGGYLSSQGYPVHETRQIIPSVIQLLSDFRSSGFPIYFTREGHRPDLSTLSAREHFRSRNNPSGIGIGDKSIKLGRCLVRGEPGHDIIPELGAWVNVLETNVIDKPGRSAFAHTDFDLLLKLKGIRNLVMCGVTTDVCVHSTMREANDRGYDCIVVEDACAAASEELHRWALESVKMEGGIFGSTGTVHNVVEGVRHFAKHPQQ